MEARLHSAVDALERERAQLQSHFDSHYHQYVLLCRDLGEPADKSALQRGCLREWCRLVEEAVAGKKAAKRQLEQQLTLRLAEWRQRAEAEGVSLCDVLMVDNIGDGGDGKLQQIKGELDALEGNWREHVQMAANKRQEIRQQCQSLCDKLHEQYCEPVAANNRVLLERLQSQRQELLSKRDTRMSDLKHCRDTFADLQMNITVDLNDLSVVNVTKWQQLCQQAVKEHCDKIKLMHRETADTLRDCHDTLSEPLPPSYIVDYDTADINVLLAHLKEMKAVLPNLQTRADRAKQVKSLLAERNALIVQMQVFERTASDPARLFAPSFRLLQEERFRKTAVPTLKRLEARLFKEVEAFDAAEAVPYTVGGVPLREVLERERAERFVNEAVFGFATAASVPSRPALSPQKPHQPGSPAPKRQRENVNNK